MYRSKEIRWFFKDHIQTIEDSISKYDSKLANAKERIDFYLPIAEKDDITLKLREGNVEAKLRQDIPVSHELISGAKGKLEDWVKWGFDVTDNDELANSIIKTKTYEWIEVKKTRIGMKFIPDGNGGIKKTKISDKTAPAPWI